MSHSFDDLIKSKNPLEQKVQAQVGNSKIPTYNEKQISENVKVKKPVTNPKTPSTNSYYKDNSQNSNTFEPVHDPKSDMEIEVPSILIPKVIPKPSSKEDQTVEPNSAEPKLNGDHNRLISDSDPDALPFVGEVQPSNDEVLKESSKNSALAPSSYSTTTINEANVQSKPDNDKAPKIYSQPGTAEKTDLQQSKLKDALKDSKSENPVLIQNTANKDIDKSLSPVDNSKEGNSDSSKLSEALDKSTTDSSSNTAVSKKSALGFSKIYCINLKSRPDLRKQVQAQADFLGLSIEFVDAVTIDSKEFRRFRNSRNVAAYFGKSKHSQMELALYASHVKVMKLMLREGLETALILEDDVEFHRNVVNQWSSIKQKTIEKNLQWKIFLLGSCYLEASYKPDQKSMYISDQVVTYEAVACTHAYAITNSAARLFLHDVKDSNEAYDNDLFKYFGSKYQGENLVVYPGLIVQIPRSKNKGSLNSGDDLEDQTLEGQGVLSIMPK